MTSAFSAIVQQRGLKMLNIDHTSTGEYRHAVPVGDFSPDSVILTYDPAMWGLHFGFC